MQLTRVQRYQIYALLKAGHCQTEIACFIRVYESTVSREPKWNSGQKGYRPKQAHTITADNGKKSTEDECIALNLHA